MKKLLEEQKKENEDLLKHNQKLFRSQLVHNEPDVNDIEEENEKIKEKEVRELWKRK